MPAESGNTPGVVGEIAVLVGDALLRDSIRLAFQRNGFSVLTAKNNQELDALIQKKMPDALILDTYLPSENSIEILGRLNQQGMTASMAVILVSAYAFSEVVQVAMQSGAADFILKPVDLDMLVSRVEKALARKTNSESSAGWIKT